MRASRFVCYCVRRRRLNIPKQHHFCLSKVDDNESVDLKEVIQYVENKLQQGDPPPMGAFHAAFKALLRQNNFDKALELRDRYHGNPTIITYSSLVGLLYNQGQYNQAIQLFAYVNHYRDYCDHIAFNAAARSYYKLKFYSAGLDHLEYMAENEIKIDTETYNVAMKAFVEDGEINRAQRMYDFMIYHWGKPNTNTFNILADYYLQHREVESAVQHFILMEFHKLAPDPNTFQIIANYVCQTSTELRRLDTNNELRYSLKWPCVFEFLLSHKLFNKTFELVQYLSNHYVLLDPRNYERILEPMCKAKQHKKVLGILANMKVKNVKKELTTYRIVIPSLCASNLVKEANELFDEAREKQKVDLELYNIMILWNARLNQKTRVLELYNDMLQIGLTPNGTTFEVMTEYFCKFHHQAEAMKAYGTMRSYRIALTGKIVSNLLYYFSIRRKGSIVKDLLSKARSLNIILSKNLLWALKMRGVTLPWRK